MANDVRNVDLRAAQKIIGPLLSLSATTSTGAGTSFDLGAHYNTFSVQAYRASGSTKASIALQGSLDNSKWATIGASTIVVNSTASVLHRSTNSAPVRFVRLKINSFSTLATTAADHGVITGYIGVL